MNCIKKHWFLFAGWLLDGWYRCYLWNGWDVGGTGVGCTNIIRRRNGSATIGIGMGAPPLDIEDRRDVGSVLVMQGRGVFVLKHQNNTNILHTNRN